MKVVVKNKIIYLSQNPDDQPYAEKKLREKFFLLTNRYRFS